MTDNPQKWTPVLINGGGMHPPVWRDFPSVAIGKSLEKPTQSCIYRISQSNVRKDLEANKRQPLLNLWSMVIGEVPPFPNAFARWGNDAGKLVSIANAHACFRGLRRPVGEDDNGFDYLALVIKPKCFFRYEPSMSCMIKLVDFPVDLVHVVYVRCDFTNGRKTAGPNPMIAGGSVGVITHSDFVEADELDPMLPVGYWERYRKRVW